MMEDWSRRDAGRRRTRIAALVAALVLILPEFAVAAEALRFAPPVLDGVSRLPSAGGDEPTAYRFSGGRDWPALRFHAAAASDWSGAGALAVPVENPGDAPFALLLRLDDDFQADGGDRSLTGLVTVPAHARATAILPLDAGPTGMRGRPIAAAATEPGDLVVTDLRGAVDIRHIVALHVSGIRTAADQVLAVGTPSLRRPAGPARGGPIADRYGQSVVGTWPEKAADDAGLRARLAAADAQTRRLAGGGAVRGPFRVEKTDGRWRLMDAAGNPFFSLGLDAVTPSNPTLVAGRRGLFEDLPAPGTPLASFLTATPQGETFDVGEANLARAWGPGWRPRWVESTAGRLRGWGFNTLGNWSDPGLAGSGLATVDFYDFQGGSTLVPMDGGRVLPDPFDPRFAAVADGVARQMTAANQSAPSLLGYFSGNEMPWGEAAKPEAGIAAHVLRLRANSPAKQALVSQLRERYGRVAVWAAAWGLPEPADWPALLDQPVPLPIVLASAARADIARFQGAFADRYFSLVRQAIRTHDPDRLYLGTRFADAPSEVVAACARWCDVMSFNVYGASSASAAARWRAFDRPVLIGEFHFGSTDRGSFWPGMVDAGSEARRGPAYAAYVAAAVRDPAVVGVHWYQYADEPLTGRPYDGENGHIGLVAVTDVPYAGFVEAVARANREALKVFSTAARSAARTVP